MYQSPATIALVFLVVKLREVLITSRKGEEDAKLPVSEIGVVVMGRILMPASIMLHTNFL